MCISGNRARAELSLGFEDDDYVLPTTYDDVNTTKATSIGVRVGMSGGSSESNTRIGTSGNGSPSKGSSANKGNSPSKSSPHNSGSSTSKGNDRSKGISSTSTSNDDRKDSHNIYHNIDSNNNNDNAVDLDLGDLEDFLQVELEDYP